MGGGDGIAQRANRYAAAPLDMIAAAGRTRGNFALAVELDVGRQIIWKADGFAIGLVIFQSELVGGRINLAHIIDAGVGGASAVLVNTIWYQYRNNNSNYANRKNQFEKRESRTGIFLLFAHGRTWAGVTVVPSEQVGALPTRPRW